MKLRVTENFVSLLYLLIINAIISIPIDNVIVGISIIVSRL